MSPGMTLFSVQAVLILGTEDGARIFTKYYSPPHTAPNGMRPLPSRGMTASLPYPPPFLSMAGLNGG